MTIQQKTALEAMMNKGRIVSGFRVIDTDNNPVVRLREWEFDKLRRVLKKDKKGGFVISIQDVRRQRKNHYAKQLYLKAKEKNGSRSNKA